MGFLSFLGLKPKPSRFADAAPLTSVPALAPAGAAALTASSSASAMPAALSAAPAADPADAAVSISNADANAIVVRNEIVDQRNRLCGYRFTVPLGSNRLALTAPQLVDTLVAADVPGFAQRRLALVPLSLDAANAGLHLPLVAPCSIFLIKRPRGTTVAQLAECMATLHAGGAKLAMPVRRLDPAEAPLLAHCAVAVLALAEHDLAEFQALARRLRGLYPDLKLLIDGVHSWDEQRMCLAWGGNYFMGHFLTTTDKIDPNAKVDQSRLTSIELLNLLRTDAELPEMIEVAKRDPGMTLQVLQWANAPGSGQIGKVTSLNQAFMVLGRNQLYRGLIVSMFRLGASATRDRDESLLEVALTRARFLELAAQGVLPQLQRDELFLVGLLSLFDVLLGVSMSNLLGKMHVTDEVRSVLEGSEGPYAPWLKLVLLLERDKIERAFEVAEEMGINADGLGAVGAQAFKWAQDALQRTGD